MENNLVNKIKKLDGVFHLKGVSEKIIAEAEEELALKFSPEYREYVKEFGCISFGNHEFTGLGTSDRLSVVAITLLERRRSGKVTIGHMYVIETLNDGEVIILQNSEGQIFEMQAYNNIMKKFDTLTDYIESL